MVIGVSTGESYEDSLEYSLAKAGRASPVTQEQGAENDRSKATEKPAGEIKINRDYKVPYISGPSNDGKTVYIDKSVPEKADIGGVSIDTAEPLKIHELIEQKALKHYQAQGMDDKEAYKKAHEDHAEPAENNWYIEHGIDPKEADKFWSKIDQHTEEEGTEDHPKDLFKAPYPHHKVEGNPDSKGIDDPAFDIKLPSEFTSDDQYMQALSKDLRRDPKGFWNKLIEGISPEDKQYILNTMQKVEPGSANEYIANNAPAEKSLNPIERESGLFELKKAMDTNFKKQFKGYK